MRTLADNTPLIIKQNTLSIPLKITVYSLTRLLLAGHIVVNGKLLSMLSSTDAAGASIAATSLGLLLGFGSGMIQATGILLGKPLAAENYLKAGDLIKLSWFNAIVLGAVSSAVLASTCFILPLLFTKNIGISAGRFLLGYASGSIPTLLQLTNQQVVFQSGDWAIPIISSAMLYIPAGVVSYYLGIHAQLGSLGVGLGGGLCSWFSSGIMYFFFFRKDYRPYHLFSSSLQHETQCYIHKIKKKWGQLIKTGGKLSLMAASEWGSLTAIAVIVGLSGENASHALHACIQV